MDIFGFLPPSFCLHAYLTPTPEVLQDLTIYIADSESNLCSYYGLRFANRKLKHGGTNLQSRSSKPLTEQCIKFFLGPSGKSYLGENFRRCLSNSVSPLFLNNFPTLPLAQG